jgi:hypothetical protein
MVLALVMPGCTVAAQKEGPMSETKVASTLECAGRFCLQVPASFARKGASFKFGMVDLKEVPLPEGAERGFKTLWSAKVAAIAALRDPTMPADNPTGRIVWKGALGPRFEAAMYHHSSMKEIGMLAGLLERDGQALSLETDLGFTFRAAVEKRFQVIGRGWRPRKAGEPWPTPSLNWFYLKESVIAEPAYGGEEVYVSFQEAVTHAKLEVTTRDVVEPEVKGLMARLGEASMRAGLSLAGAVSVVRSGRRTAAGEKGDELILKVEDGKELAFAWTFPGGKDDSDHPEIVIKLETTSENQKEKLALWDRVLDSLRPAAAP